MAVQNLQHRAFAEQAFVIQRVHDVVVNEGSAALVHYLGLFLRIEVLPDIADNSQNFALPRLENRAVLFGEIQKVFLGQVESFLPLGDVALELRGFLLVFGVRQGTPDVTERPVLVCPAFVLAVHLFAQ